MENKHKIKFEFKSVNYFNDQYKHIYYIILH
jgi:hypothetical protein